MHRYVSLSLAAANLVTCSAGNDLIPYQHAEGLDNFVRHLSSLVHEDPSPDLAYSFILLLLCHVDDFTLVRARGWKSSRSRVLRPDILGALSIPPSLAQLARVWAHVQDLNKGC